VRQDIDQPEQPDKTAHEPRPEAGRLWKLVGRLTVVEVFLIQAYLWLGFLIQTKRSPASPILIVNDVIAVIVGIGLVIFIARRSPSLPQVFGRLLIVASLLVVDFSFLYWSRGTSANFTHPLSHLDAIYFTVGTLSTAGTGTISAISATARSIQTAQMVLNLGFLLFAVTAVVGRITGPRAA